MRTSDAHRLPGTALLRRQYAGRRTPREGADRRDTLTSSPLLNTSRDDMRADVRVSANGHNEMRHARRFDHAAERADGDQIDFLVGTADENLSIRLSELTR